LIFFQEFFAKIQYLWLGYIEQRAKYLQYFETNKEKMDTIFNIGYQAAKDSYEKQNP
jgi:hypothetical protein